MAKVKLAEALLRRKELAAKVTTTQSIKMADLFETKVTRKLVSDNIDEVTLKIPKLDLSEVVAENDHYAKSLRHVDAAIQQANWNTEIEVPDFAMTEFKK